MTDEQRVRDQIARFEGLAGTTDPDNLGEWDHRKRFVLR